MATSLTQSRTAKLQAVLKYSDFLVAVAAVVIIGMMIMPLPDWLLDVLLTLNITLALTVLLVTIYTIQPLEFASFPSMLLVATLFRLALNIAGTRLILLHGGGKSVV